MIFWRLILCCFICKKKKKWHKWTCLQREKDSPRIFIAPTLYIISITFSRRNVYCLVKLFLDKADNESVSSFYLFIYLFILAVLGLRCCAQAFSSCGERGLLFIVVRGAYHCGGFSCCRAQALGTRASVAVARGLSSCGSWALECRLSSCGARA